jgi:WD40 repeat protein
VGLWLSNIEVWDLTAPRRLRMLEGHTQVVTSLALGPPLGDGHHALLSTSGDGAIKMWDATTGSCLLTLNPENGPGMKIVCTPDQRSLISAHLDGTLAVWDLGHYDDAIRTATSRIAAEAAAGGQPDAVKSR